MKKILAILALMMFAITSVVGCADSDPDNHNGEVESPAKDACEHIDNGKAGDLNASKMMDDTAPKVDPHKYYEVTLPDATAPAKEGYVKFNLAAKGDVNIAVTTAVSELKLFKVSDKSEVDVTKEVKPTVPDCDKLKGLYTFEAKNLEVGDYYVKLGSSDGKASPVGLVVLAGEENE